MRQAEAGIGNFGGEDFGGVFLLVRVYRRKDGGDSHAGNSHVPDFMGSVSQFGIVQQRDWTPVEFIAAVNQIADSADSFTEVAGPVCIWGECSGGREADADDGSAA